MRVSPVGEHGVLVEVASASQVAAVYAELLARAADGRLRAGEIVPAARTVLVTGLARPGALAAELTAWRLPPARPPAGEPVEIPVRYDGPDLAGVARLWGVSAEEAARLHHEVEYRVAFCGFAPGFGYLTGLPERLHVPRLATPRTSVPAGAVALAGPYAGVYPRSSPGGWRIIGSTNAVLWDVGRVPAALLAPGARVRFVPERVR
jgi:KipI family sensor histidine kinase inhibitor